MRKKVLVTDDDADIRQALCQYLELSGYDPIEAPHGDYALEVLKRDAVDVLITDMVMPQKGGQETIAAARRAKPGIVIIAISGALRVPGTSMTAGISNLVSEAEELSVDGFLRKPFRSKDLVALIDSLTSGSGDESRTGPDFGTQPIPALPPQTRFGGARH